MTVYLDTSVILRRLLGEPGQVKDWGDWDQACTSAITSLEALRALDRLRLEGKLNDAEISKLRWLFKETLARLWLIGLNSSVMEHASQSFPIVIGSLDAIHLASAMVYRESKSKITFLTHDVRLGLAAQALGFETGGL